MSELTPGWTEKIEQAQHQTTDTVLGQVFARIRFGDEAGFPAGADTCRDCAVERGQWHVIGCCVERCARCRIGQALACATCGLDA